MKTKQLQHLADELIKKLPKNTDLYKSDDEILYYSFSGIEDGKYFGIYIIDFGNGYEIEVSHTTKNPKRYVDMIKEILPEADVIFYEVQYEKVKI